MTLGTTGGSLACKSLGLGPLASITNVALGAADTPAIATCSSYGVTSSSFEDCTWKWANINGDWHECQYGAYLVCGAAPEGEACTNAPVEIARVKEIFANTTAMLHIAVQEEDNAASLHTHSCRGEQCSCAPDMRLQSLGNAHGI